MPAGLKRYYGKGHLHFITFTCYRRLPLLKTARARDIFVQELGKLRDATGFHLIGYVVMPEHVHLLISEPPQGTPSTVLDLRRYDDAGSWSVIRHGAVSVQELAAALG